MRGHHEGGQASHLTHKWKLGTTWASQLRSEGPGPELDPRPSGLAPSSRVRSDLSAPCGCVSARPPLKLLVNSQYPPPEDLFFAANREHGGGGTLERGTGTWSRGYGFDLGDQDSWGHLSPWTLWWAATPGPVLVSTEGWCQLAEVAGCVLLVKLGPGLFRPRGGAISILFCLLLKDTPSVTEGKLRPLLAASCVRGPQFETREEMH